MHLFITFLAQYLIVVPFVVGLIIFVRLPTNRDKKQFVLEGVFAAVLVLLLAKLGSILFYNPRPFIVGHFTPYFAHGNDNGFPSDHTLVSSFIAALVYYKNRKLGLVLLLVALIIGLSRVIAGVHHLIDIAGGFAFSAVGVALAMYILRTLDTKRSSS